MDGKSLDIAQDNLAKLKSVFPEVVQDGKVDFEALKAVLGEDVYPAGERYGLSWPGKAEAFREVQKQTTKTLVPDREGSVDFDDSQHLFIEGDNLEALRVLQRSYYGKVKMIYIDPPYNTGNDFIYNDKFAQNKKEYLKEIGAIDAEGNVINAELYKRNVKENGHFHSTWLNMMYPRLYLARNLMKNDGVIFVSIDDTEVANLRLLMDLVFGEENFESQITWRRRHNQPNDKSKMVAKVAEYILTYSKSSTDLKKHKTYYGLPLSEERQEEYTNPDNDPNGRWTSNPWKAAVGRGGSKYKLTTIDGTVYDETWYGSKETFNEHVKNGRVHWTDNGSGYPRIKVYLEEAKKSGQAGINFFTHERFGSNQQGSADLQNLLGKEGIFDNPKPSILLQSLTKLATKDDDLILDFFAGSGTLAQAVMELNQEDGGKRKYICVQLPEYLKADDKDQKAGHDFCKKLGKATNIAEISKERIRRVITKIKEEQNDSLDFAGDNKPDLGFKAFKLKDSNFRLWNGDIPADEIEAQINAFVDNTKPEATEEAMLFELMLKAGFALTAKVEKHGTAYIVEGKHAFVIKETTDEGFRALLEQKPERVTALEQALSHEDNRITSTQLMFEDAGVEFGLI